MRRATGSAALFVEVPQVDLQELVDEKDVRSSELALFEAHAIQTHRIAAPQGLFNGVHGRNAD